MLAKSVVVLALFGSLLAVAGAQTKKPAAATCPVCHMALASKKSKSNPTAMRLTKKGKVLYCCGGCKMPASMLVKPKK
jgi:hypothetical protein